MDGFNILLTTAHSLRWYNWCPDTGDLEGLLLRMVMDYPKASTGEQTLISAALSLLGEERTVAILANRVPLRNIPPPLRAERLGCLDEQNAASLLAALAYQVHCSAFVPALPIRLRWTPPR